MPKSILFAALLICAANAYRAHAQCIPSKERSPRTEFFSTVEVIKNVGPAGSELQMEEEVDRVVATLREYRGNDAPKETKLQGVLMESGTAGTMAPCIVRLSGRDHRGPVNVEGEITLARFRGSITRYIAKKSATYQISLRRRMHEYEYSVGAASVFLLMRRAHCALSRYSLFQREDNGHATETD
jgi:hypothetical protein